MCNGTVALEIAIRALGLTGEVIVPSFTFIATAHALAWQEIAPVFCDVDPRTHNLDPAKIEAMITPRTSAIIGVHLWGRGCDVAALTEIAKRRGLRLLFDASHAFLCSHGGRPIGGFGEAEVFSFHATKFFQTAEGGAVVTNDDALAEKIRLMKNFGFAGFDNVIRVGTNGKMDELSAAMGLSGLETIDEVVRVNRTNYHAYRDALGDLAGVNLIHYDPTEQGNFQYVVAEIDADRTGLHRDELVKVLHAENVIARRYFHPGCHRMEPYRSLQPHAHLLLPETERLAQRVMALPTGTAVGPQEIGKIGEILRSAIGQADEVARRLRS
jgi:dTDP-4-amino-4,6-dideoxygalactose transaminase